MLRPRLKRVKLLRWAGLRPWGLCRLWVESGHSVRQVVVAAFQSIAPLGLNLLSDRDRADARFLDPLHR